MHGRERGTGLQAPSGDHKDTGNTARPPGKPAGGPTTTHTQRQSHNMPGTRTGPSQPQSRPPQPSPRCQGRQAAQTHLPPSVFNRFIFHLVRHPEAQHPGDHALKRDSPNRDHTPPLAAVHGEKTGTISSPAPQLRGWGSQGQPDVTPPTPSPLRPKAHHTAGVRPHTHMAHTRIPPICRTPGGAQQDPPPTQRGRHGPQ